MLLLFAAVYCYNQLNTLNEEQVNFCALKTYMHIITGCTVAQHCYISDVSFLRENGNFDPCKIGKFKQIATICQD